MWAAVRFNKFLDVFHGCFVYTDPESDLQRDQCAIFNSILNGRSTCYPTPIVLNGDFEAPDFQSTAWSFPPDSSALGPITVSLVNSPVHSGSHALLFQSYLTLPVSITQPIMVKQGKTYDISFWYQVSGVVGTCGIRVYDGTNSGMYTIGSNGSEWKQEIKSFTAEVRDEIGGPIQWELKIDMICAHPSPRLYIDDVFVQERV